MVVGIFKRATATIPPVGVHRVVEKGGRSIQKTANIADTRLALREGQVEEQYDLERGRFTVSGVSQAAGSGGAPAVLPSGKLGRRGRGRGGSGGSAPTRGQKRRAPETVVDVEESAECVDAFDFSFGLGSLLAPSSSPRGKASRVGQGKRSAASPRGSAPVARKSSTGKCKILGEAEKATRYHESRNRADIRD